MDVKDARAVSLSIPLNRTKSAPSPIPRMIRKRQINKMIHGLCVLGGCLRVCMLPSSEIYTFL